MTTSQNTSGGPDAGNVPLPTPAGSPRIPAQRQESALPAQPQRDGVPSQRRGSGVPAAVPTARPRPNRFGTTAWAVGVGGLLAAVLLIGPALSSEPTTTSGAAGDTLTVGDLQMTTSPLTAGESMFGPTLCSTVTYRNTGSAPESIDAMAEWTLGDPSGSTASAGLVGTDSGLSVGQLAGGRTVSGDVCFDRTATRSGRYVVQFTPRGFSSERGAWTNQVG